MRVSKTTGRALSISKVEKSVKDIKALVKSEISEHFETEFKIDTTKELWQLTLVELLELCRNDQSLDILWELYQSEQNSLTCLNTKWRGEIDLIEYFFNKGIPSQIIDFLLNHYSYWFLADLKLVLNCYPDLSWCDLVDYIAYSCNYNLPICMKYFVFWFYKVPKQHEYSLSRIIRHTYKEIELVSFFDELVLNYNSKIIGDLELEALLLFDNLNHIYEFVLQIQNIDFSNSCLFQLIVKNQLKKQTKKQHSLKYRKLESKPIWCDDHIWELFNNEKAYTGAEIVHKIKDALLKQYSPAEYFYVCMARDSVPLYVLLFEAGFDCLLGVFSRAQIGCDDSIELLKDEITTGIETTGKKPILVDIQGRGTIYDHLRDYGIDHEMVFGVSSNPKNCRYPLLIEDDHIGNQAIKYLEKLPQNNGRAESVYEVTRCENSYIDVLIAWGTRDPNAMGGDLEDWGILQFRGLFMETMGVSHCHAGMIGNDTQQRLWGVFKNRLPVYDWEIGIAVYPSVLELIKSSRYKTQHEIEESHGTYDPEWRLKSEIEQFGNNGIRPSYGTIWNDKYNSHLGSVRQYGDNMMVLNADKLLPYITITREDSLDEDPEIFYPATKMQKLLKTTHRYCEIQLHTLITFDLVIEVKNLEDCYVD